MRLNEATRFTCEISKLNIVFDDVKCILYCSEPFLTVQLSIEQLRMILDAATAHFAICHLRFDTSSSILCLLSSHIPYILCIYLYRYGSISASLHRQSILATWNNGAESLWLCGWYEARTGRLDTILFYWSLESVNSIRFGAMSVPSAIDYTWSCSTKKCIKWPLTSQLLINRIV